MQSLAEPTPIEAFNQLVAPMPRQVAKHFLNDRAMDYIRVEFKHLSRKQRRQAARMLANRIAKKTREGSNA